MKRKPASFDFLLSRDQGFDGFVRSREIMLTGNVV